MIQFSKFPSIKFTTLAFAIFVGQIVLTHSAFAGSTKSNSASSTAGQSSSSLNTSKKSAPILDTALVRKEYLDGDFDQAIELLEKGLKEKRPFTHYDSVFIFKHLGVMYAAKYDTREKGKYYMHQLLLVEPTAKILDMYASDMIYMIFKNIQDEFEETTGRLTRAQSHVNGNAQTRPSENKPADKPVAKEAKSSDHTLLWVGVGTVAVGAGVAAYFLLASSPSSTQDTHGLP